MLYEQPVFGRIVGDGVNFQTRDVLILGFVIVNGIVFALIVSPDGTWAKDIRIVGTNQLEMRVDHVSDIAPAALPF